MHRLESYIIEEAVRKDEVRRQCSVLEFLGLHLCNSCFFSFFDDLLIDFIGFLQQEVGEVVDGVVRYVFAEVDETLGEVRNHVVHQVLPDWL